MFQFFDWLKYNWHYALAAILCAIIPAFGANQTSSADLYLILTLIVMPGCVFSLGCILSLKTEEFSFSIPFVMFLTSQLVQTVPFALSSNNLGAVLAMAVIASMPTLFLLWCELFFLCVRLYSDVEMNWIGYFALLLICLPLASDLLTATSTYFIAASFAMGFSSAAVVLFMYLYRQEYSFCLSAWTLMLGFPILFLYNITMQVHWTRALVLLLLPTASTILATAFVRFYDLTRKN